MEDFFDFSKLVERIQESEQRYKDLVESIPYSVYVIDRDWRYSLVNAVAERSLGLSRDNIIGRKIFDFLPNVENTDFFRVFKSVMEERKPTIYTNSYFFPDEGTKWYEVHVYPVPEGIMYISIDITKRKLNEDKLRESEERFRTLFEESPIAIMLTNSEGHIITINKAAIELFGLKDEYVKKFIDSINLFSLSDDNVYVNLRDKVISNEKVKFEYPLDFSVLKEQVLNCGLEKTGIAEIDGNVIPISIDDGQRLETGYLMLLQDVTSRKNAERRLMESEARYKAIVEDQSELIIRFLPSGYITFFNDSFCRYIGIERDSVIQYHIRRFFYYDEDWRIFQEKLEKLSPVEPIFSMECRILLPMGTVRWVTWITRAIIDETGNIVEYQSVGRDITNQKLIDESIEDLNKRLLASNSELEQFAYFISHDLREPLSLMSAFFKFLEDKISDKIDDEARDYINFIRKSVSKMDKHIYHLLEYSKLGTKENSRVEEVNIKTIIRNALDNLMLKIDEKKAIIICDEDFPVLKVDAVQMELLFQNLISNGIKFNNSNPPIIRISVREEEKEWIFSIQDNGIGIEKKHFERIFIMFQRLHNENEYSGNGVGLANCKKIIEKHNGKIWLESSVGNGSVFYFSLLKD
jgi:PAS domain S-box-containing protein